MKNKRAYPFLQYLMILGSTVFLSHCAKQKEKVNETPVTTTEEIRTEEAAKRLCTDQITGTTSASIAGFFGKIVRNLEGPPTFCLTLDTSSGNSGAKGTLRLEYEDDFGIRYYQINEDATYFGDLVQTDTELSIDVVFIDGAGFVQVKATENTTSGLMEGTVKYHNFPSYESALTTAAQEAAAKCKSGEMKVAQCLGYNFPSTFWWNEPIAVSPRQQMLDQAKAILKDSTKTKTLGNVQFDIGLVLSQ